MKKYILNFGFILLFNAISSFANTVEEKILRTDRAELFEIKKEYVNDFVNDPVNFVTDNFNLKKNEVWANRTKYIGFNVFFQTNKGLAQCFYSKEGDLIKIVWNFKNIILPMDLRQQLHAENKGWELTKTRFVGKHLKNKSSSHYIVHLKKEGERKRTKIFV